MRHNIVFCIVTLILSFIFYKNADSAVKNNTFFEIDWKSGLIKAQAIYNAKYDDNGVPIIYNGKQSINKIKIDTYGRAQSSAIEILMSGIKDFQIEPGVKMMDIINKSDYTRSHLESMIGGKIFSKEYPVDFWSARSEVQLSFKDIIAVLPYNYPNQDFPVIRDKAYKTNYTSIIVDVRGAGFKPSLFPSILDEDGLEVISRNYIDINYAYKYGMVSYCYNENEAGSMKIAGDFPLYTVSLNLVNGRPVIAHSDVKKIYSSGETLENVKKCRIIFIIDR